MYGVFNEAQADSILLTSLNPRQAPGGVACVRQASSGSIDIRLSNQKLLVVLDKLQRRSYLGLAIYLTHMPTFFSPSHVESANPT